MINQTEKYATLRVKENKKPTLPHTEMVCDKPLSEKLNKYELTQFLNCGRLEIWNRRSLNLCLLILC